MRIRITMSFHPIYTRTFGWLRDFAAAMTTTTDDYSPDSSRPTSSSSSSSKTQSDVSAARPATLERTVSAASATSSSVSNSNRADHPLPPLSRTYTPPDENIDIEAALAQKPKPWSIRGQMEANFAREKLRSGVEECKEQKKKEFAAAKEELLSAMEELKQLKIKPPQPRREGGN